MYNYLIKAKDSENHTFIVALTGENYDAMLTKFNAMKGNQTMTIEKVLNVQEIKELPVEGTEKNNG